MARSRNRNRSQRAQRVSKRRVHMRRNSRKNQKSRNRNTRRSRRVRRRSNLKMRGGHVENVKNIFNVSLPDALHYDTSIKRAATILFNPTPQASTIEESAISKVHPSTDKHQEYFEDINFIYKGSTDQYNEDDNTFTLLTSNEKLTKKERKIIAPLGPGGKHPEHVKYHTFRVSNDPGDTTPRKKVLEVKDDTQVSDSDRGDTWFQLVKYDIPINK